MSVPPLCIGGELNRDRHLLPVRVYYEDTDASGIVYHASYLRFLERGRTEFLRALGIEQHRLLTAPQRSLGFVVRHMSIDFLKPARMDELLIVETSVRALRGASVLLEQRLLRADDRLVGADVLIAAVSQGRPARLPPELRGRLASVARAG